MEHTLIENSAKKIRVSIIMLTYQRAPLIMESVNSILQQSFEEYELLILDDGSTDNTKELIDSIKDPRIKYFSFEHTSKISYLRNFGIKHSHGKYVAFIDSDDLWEKDKLKNQAAILDDNPEVGLTFSEIEEFSTNGFSKKGLYHAYRNGEKFYRGSIFNFLIANKMAIYPSSVMFRRDCLERTGLLDEKLRPGESNFFIRLSFSFEAYIEFEYLVKIRKHPGNTSPHLLETSFNEMVHTITYFYNEGDISKKIFTQSLLSLQYGFALDFWRKKDFVHSRIQLLNCLKTNPFFFKAALRYLLSHLKRK